MPMVCKESKGTRCLKEEELRKQLFFAILNNQYDKLLSYNFTYTDFYSAFKKISQSQHFQRLPTRELDNFFQYIIQKTAVRLNKTDKVEFNQLDILFKKDHPIGLTQYCPALRYSMEEKKEEKTRQSKVVAKKLPDLRTQSATVLPTPATDSESKLPIVTPPVETVKRSGSLSVFALLRTGEGFSEDSKDDTHLKNPYRSFASYLKF